jgi:hypothetical protein
MTLADHWYEQPHTEYVFAILGDVSIAQKSVSASLQISDMPSTDASPRGLRAMRMLARKVRRVLTPP